jgi:hypothetical protein
VKAYEASWSRRFERLDDVLEELKDQEFKGQQEFKKKEDRHGSDGDQWDCGGDASIGYADPDHA